MRAFLVTAISAIAVSCAPNPSAPVSIMAMLYDQTNTLGPQQTTLQTIQSVASMSGSVATLYGGGAEILLDPNNAAAAEPRLILSPNADSRRALRQPRWRRHRRPHRQGPRALARRLSLVEHGHAVLELRAGVALLPEGLGHQDRPDVRSAAERHGAVLGRLRRTSRSPTPACKTRPTTRSSIRRSRPSSSCRS